MSQGLSNWAREVLERPRSFATLATTSGSGTPHQTVIWYAVAADDLLVNARAGRIWATNLLRDPRYSLMVENGYEWVSVRGTAAAHDDPAQAREDISAMARAYYADEPDKMARHIDGFMQQDRISFRLQIDGVTEHPDD